MSYFQRKKYKVLTFLVLRLFLFVRYFYFCYSHYDNWGPWHRAEWLQGSHHGRGCCSLREINVIYSSPAKGSFNHIHIMEMEQGAGESRGGEGKERQCKGKVSIFSPLKLNRVANWTHLHTAEVWNQVRIAVPSQYLVKKHMWWNYDLKQVHQSFGNNKQNFIKREVRDECNKVYWIYLHLHLSAH